MKEMVVLYPAMGMGHLTPMVELAKLFLRDGLAVTVLVVDPPFKQGSSAPFIAATSAAHPSLFFHQVPAASLQPESSPSSNPVTPMSLMLDTLREATAQLHLLIKSLSESSTVRALVVDFFCTDALEVATALGLPCYLFFPSAATSLAVELYLPTLHSTTSTSFKDLGDAPVHFPGLHPIPASDMPGPLQDRNDDGYKALLVHLQRFPRFDGILVNSFESLEPRAVKALKDGICLPDRPMPPTYCIGPLIAEGKPSEKHECITWLDSQPKASVVFLCFGSMGSFPAEQLKETATGLERSGQRFLWVVRAPRNGDQTAKFPGPRLEPDLEAILPVGFLERTKDRGLVVKSWAPQVEVLAHEAVGAFVTHCGWNSTLEGVCAGVPLIGWPLYAEQRMNKVMLVQDIGLAVAVEGYDRELVGAEEVEAKVRWVMESEGGNKLRKRAAVMAEKAKEAWKDGGSSKAAWVEVVKVIKNGGNGVRG
ncbi:UDP-glycosyltransferase 88F3-like [Phoenix dactylifera]|uniref:Glycosyltransferase n=1 Tax=Phoenix dactylifera TaxID=42345 RepID=A0A8B7BIM9_PHODC|nr:UDP-glycosyltransferase 88F3-like [Phoenix dactylifera]